MEIMDYVWYFLEIVFYTLGAIFVCGLAICGCQYLFCWLLGGKVGCWIVAGTSIIGTPVHELGHLIMCLIFGHKVDEVVLWKPNSGDGTLGYVTHRCNTRNIYQNLGNLFIGIGPILSGIAVLTLALHLCFPNTLRAYYASAQAMVRTGENVLAIFLEGLKMIPNMIGEFGNGAVPVWGRTIAVLVMLSVSLHINLSPADIQNLLSALPMYLAIVLAVTVITSLLGAAAMGAVSGALQLFSACLMALFVIVLVFAVVQVLLAFVYWLIFRVIF